MNWHTLTEYESAQALYSDLQDGLDAQEAKARLAKSGYNEIRDQGGRSPLQIIWEQLTATMVLILLGAAALAFALGDSKNTIAISAIVVFYLIIGFIQEYRAEKAIASLKQLSTPVVRVRRGGSLVEISSRELVPGDVVILEAGNILPADLRLTSAINLRVQEAALTGESAAVEKHTQALPAANIPLGDRVNLAFSGTVITQGRGEGIVYATGMQTELGKIAGLIQSAPNQPTPLQQRLDQLGKNLAVIGSLISIFILIIGLWRGDEIRHMLLTAISVAVAIVPEGLPAVVTITLAIGAQRMLARNALIRKLPAVETLGSVTVICSDKTGTLTENRMTVVVLDTAGHELRLSEELRGDTVRMSTAAGIPTRSPLSLLLVGGALCNDASLVAEGDNRFHTIGDPTEGALVASAARFGYRKRDLEGVFPRIAEIPFDSERKRMTTFHTADLHALKQLSGLESGSAGIIAFTKGSVDGLLEQTSHVFSSGKTEVLDAEWRGRIQSANDQLARQGMRVLGLAYRLWSAAPAPDADTAEKNLVFIGLFGLIDPPRPEVFHAIASAREAGIRTVMITGDHPLTAREIARQLGIAISGRVLTGVELDSISTDELKELVREVNIYARVSPEHKLKIVNALKANSQIVSMTGDGVNDAPALRQADIGVAMGITGTDVTKEAADLVLLDDNFATIIAAVAEGRTIFENIRKFVRFSVGGNIGKVLVMILSPFLGKPIPLTPIQLLWLNLLTDGLLGIGLGLEPADESAMHRPPHKPGEGVFQQGGARQTGLAGLLIGMLGLAFGAGYFFSGRENWQSMVFTVLSFAQVGQALAVAEITPYTLLTRLRMNPLFALMIGAVVTLQLAVVYLPPLQGFFGTLPLNALDLLLTFGAAGLAFFAIKFFNH